MSKLTNFLEQTLEKIRESEAFQQLKTKYDELDGQAKLYINLGVVASVVVFVVVTILIGIFKVNGMKSEIDEREELIGYLQRSGDTIKQLRAQQQTSRGNADASNLPSYVTTTLETSGIGGDKAEIGGEQQGAEDKESREVFLDVKLSQINLRQLTRFMFNLTSQGNGRVNVRDLSVDTKGDPSGYLDATVTVASYRAK